MAISSKAVNSLPNHLLIPSSNNLKYSKNNFRYFITQDQSTGSLTIKQDNSPVKKNFIKFWSAIKEFFGGKSINATNLSHCLTAATNKLPTLTQRSTYPTGMLIETLKILDGIHNDTEFAKHFNSPQGAADLQKFNTIKLAVDKELAKRANQATDDCVSLARFAHTQQLKQSLSTLDLRTHPTNPDLLNHLNVTDAAYAIRSNHNVLCTLLAIPKQTSIFVQGKLNPLVGKAILALAANSRPSCQLQSLGLQQPSWQDQLQNFSVVKTVSPKQVAVDIPRLLPKTILTLNHQGKIYQLQEPITDDDQPVTIDALIAANQLPLSAQEKSKLHDFLTIILSQNIYQPLGNSYSLANAIEDNGSSIACIRFAPATAHPRQVVINLQDNRLSFVQMKFEYQRLLDAHGNPMAEISEPQLVNLGDLHLDLIPSAANSHKSLLHANIFAGWGVANCTTSNKTVAVYN